MFHCSSRGKVALQPSPSSSGSVFLDQSQDQALKVNLVRNKWPWKLEMASSMGSVNRY